MIFIHDPILPNTLETYSCLSLNGLSFINFTSKRNHTTFHTSSTPGPYYHHSHHHNQHLFPTSIKHIKSGKWSIVAWTLLSMLHSERTTSPPSKSIQSH